MAKRPHVRLDKVGGPPNHERWVWLPHSLLYSPAWRAQTIHCRRLVDFLLMEHMAHNGYENGRLVATYNQLHTFGVGRKYVAGAIALAEALGLVAVVRGGKRNQVEDHPNRYRLTWLATQNRDGRDRYFVPGTNEWDKVTDDDVRRITRELRAIKAAKKSFKDDIRARIEKRRSDDQPGTSSMPRGGTVSVHHPEPEMMGRPQ